MPNTTQIPNYIFDELMPTLSDTELRVLLIICRHTLGWIEDPSSGRRKEKDWISYSQLCAEAGRQREAVSKALRVLENRHLIKIFDKNGNLLESKVCRVGRQLFYRLATSSESELVTSNQFGNRISESEHTKETLNKSINVKTKPPYPLNSPEIVDNSSFSFSTPLMEFRTAHAVKDPKNDNNNDDNDIVRAMIAFTGSQKSKNFYKKMVSQLGKEEVVRKLDEAQKDVIAGKVKDKGKYFNWLLRTEKRNRPADSPPLDDWAKDVLDKVVVFCGRDDEYFKNTISKYIRRLGPDQVYAAMKDTECAQADDKDKYLIHLLKTTLQEEEKEASTKSI